VSALPPAGSAAASAPPPTAGWFGKIPALGDFVSRRLPAEFIEAWDIWLSEELFGAQEKLGENWLESYLKAPIWRFALMPGALDARHWFGVLMPSVDRIGRQFPLTFAASFAPAVEALGPWWSELIGVAMKAKEGCDVDALEQALLASRGTSQPDHTAGPLVSALSAAGAGASVWWSWRSEAREAEIVSVIDGLPRGDRFLALIGAGFTSLATQNS
jgi:type VI secretion system ImpM family protein